LNHHNLLPLLHFHIPIRHLLLLILILILSIVLSTIATFLSSFISLTISFLFLLLSLELISSHTRLRISGSQI
jgi:hypothetical protein